MEDRDIVELYRQRDEQAIRETSDKYGTYCFTISNNILADISDSEENVNDTYMKVWTSIPPHCPDSLKAYVAKIARNLALNRYKAKHADKRCGSEFALSLDELDGCVPSTLTVEDEALVAGLGESISKFLHKQSTDVRRAFVCRYFYCDSIEDIANRLGCGNSRIKSMLMRTRVRLKEYLKEEGYYEE